ELKRPGSRGSPSAGARTACCMAMTMSSPASQEADEVSCRAAACRSGMRRIINLQQPLTIDLGIDLRCGKRRMPKQLLDLAKICARRQKMGREGVAQGMRRRGLGKRQLIPDPRHRELNEAR